jgi:ectoine hydroxylase-related dioxygenase (phytanoyl-CoA dioxygenase family)
MKRSFHTGAKGGLGVWTSDARELSDSGGLDLNDPELYYNTTSAEKRAYWAGKDLPVPTTDLGQMRRDMERWGYCLVAEAMSAEQLAAVRTRVYEQAAGERKAGVAYFGAGTPRPGEVVPPIQLVHSLLNKGDLFRRVLEFEPDVFQGGPVVEQILTEMLGPTWLVSTFLSLITEKSNLPQSGHLDQVTAPYISPVAPMSCNTMILLDDFSPENGGTLICPGSHKITSQNVSIDNPLPPMINVTAPAGTALMFEGRMIHGAGVNRTNKPRAALILDSRCHFLRAQELFLYSVAEDVLSRLSPKTLGRLGFYPSAMGGAEGTFTATSQLTHRLALSSGTYTPIRHLDANSSGEELAKDYTYRHTDMGLRLNPHQKEAVEAVKSKFAGLKPKDGKVIEGASTVKLVEGSIFGKVGSSKM